MRANFVPQSFPKIWNPGSLPQGSFGADIAPRHVLEHGWGSEKVGKRAPGRARGV